MHVLLQGPLVRLHLKKYQSFKKHQIQDKEQVLRCTVSVLFNMKWSNKGNQILLGLSTLNEVGRGGVWALNRPSASFTCRTYIWKDWIIEYGQKHNRGFFQSQGENFSYVVIRTPLRERFQSRTHLSHLVKMVEVLYFWPLVFEYLEQEDLVSVSSLCFAWWGFVFQGSKSTAKALNHC